MRGIKYIHRSGNKKVKIIKHSERCLTQNNLNPVNYKAAYNQQ
jgi:hypothetical protein